MWKKCTPLWREAHLEVKSVKKNDGFRALLEVEMLKSARRCDAKHISKSNCTKRTMFRALLEVEMLKKCTPLRREAHFQVKINKTPGVRLRCDFARQVQGILHLAKSEQDVKVL